MCSFYFNSMRLFHYLWDAFAIFICGCLWVCNIVSELGHFLFKLLGFQKEKKFTCSLFLWISWRNFFLDNWSIFNLSVSHNKTCTVSLRLCDDFVRFVKRYSFSPSLDSLEERIYIQHKWNNTLLCFDSDQHFEDCVQTFKLFCSSNIHVVDSNYSGNMCIAVTLITGTVLSAFICMLTNLIFTTLWVWCHC